LLTITIFGRKKGKEEMIATSRLEEGRREIALRVCERNFGGQTIEKEKDY